MIAVIEWQEPGATRLTPTRGWFRLAAGAGAGAEVDVEADELKKATEASMSDNYESSGISLEERLAMIGLEMPPSPGAKGRYQPAIRDGRRLWVSGHTARLKGRAAAAGRVDVEVDIEDARTSARLAAVNLLAAAAAVVDPAEIHSVLFLRGYVQAQPDFADHPRVVDAASEVLDHALGAAGHARAAIGVASLPGRACVELEAVFRLR